MPGNQVASADEQPLGDAIDKLRDSIVDDELSRVWRRELALIGVLVSVIAVVALVAFRTDGRGVERLALRVASDSKPEQQWLAPGFHQGLRSYLEAGEQLRVIEPSVTHGSVLAQPEPGTSPLSLSAGVDWIVRVRLRTPIDVGRVTAQIELTEVGGDALYVAELHSDLQSISDLAARSALQVFDWLQVDPFSAAQRAAARAVTPDSSSAMESFSRALLALDRQDARSALGFLDQALADAPKHPTVHAMRSQAQLLLGFRREAMREIDLAVEYSQGLPREHQLAISAQRSFLNSDWAAAVEGYAALVTFYPEEPRYGLALADSLIKNRDIDRAHTVLDRVEQASFPGDPRVSLMRARAFYEAGRWAPGRTSVELAIRNAGDLGHRGTLASALVYAVEMGSQDKIPLLDRAEALFVELENPVGRSRVLRERGSEFRARGLLAEAEGVYVESVRIAERIANDAELASAMNGLAIVRDLQGRLQEGLKLKGAVLANYRRRNVAYGVGLTLEAMVISQLKLGRLGEADALLDEAEQHFERTGDAIGTAWVPYRRGRISIARGDLQVARPLLLQAIQNSEERPEGSLRDHALFELARLDARQRLDGSEQALRDSIARYHAGKLGLDRGVAMVALATLLDAQGGSREPQVLLEEAAGIFREGDAPYYLAQALVTLVWRGNTAACDELSQILERIGHRNAELLAKLALAKCRATPEISPQLRAEIDSSELFEPKLALLALESPGRAQQVSAESGWIASGYIP